MPRTTKRSNGPDSQADLHGVSATTNFSSPLFIINGPIRKRLDVNCGSNLIIKKIHNRD